MASYNEVNGNVLSASQSHTSNNSSAKPKMMHHLPRKEAMAWQLYLDGVYPTISCVLGSDLN